MGGGRGGGVNTHDGGHVVLGTRGDEHTEVRFAVVHAQVHGGRRFSLHVLVHAPWRHQQPGGIAVVPVPISYESVKKTGKKNNPL